MRLSGLFAGPLMLAVFLLVPPPGGLGIEAWRVAGVAVFMAVWWITEAIPIPATALLPVLLFPLLGVGTVAEASTPFANPLIHLFLGGFIIALGMEKSMLHRRIALRVVSLAGPRPGFIIIGMMSATAFLSMWVSNTATAMMMLPIALSLIGMADREEAAGNDGSKENFAVVMLLGLAYACNVGGIGTLVGTAPNALVAAYMLDNYGVRIGFGQWMLIGVPIVVVSLPLIYLVLARVVFPLRMRRLPGGAAVIGGELRAMGKTSRAEKSAGAVFVMTAVLWVLRPLIEKQVPGINDTAIAIFGALCMFLLPANAGRGKFLLDWEDTKRLPWGVLILFGGGLSLADAITRTGLAGWIGAGLGGLGALPVIAIAACTLLLIVFLTEVTSNTATAAAFVPILASVAVTMGRDPLLLVIPAAIGVSCAFMLPVATPPNAIVFGSGMVSIPQMAKTGLILNFVMTIVITLVLYLLMGAVFGVGYDM